MTENVAIVALSDQHGHLPEVPACDLVLIGGDVCPIVDHTPSTQRDWLLGPFADWLAALPAQRVVGIAGNHDFVFQTELAADVAQLPWTYLQDEHADVLGMRVHGTPWTPWFHDWAFNAPEGEEAGEAFLAGRLAAVPAGVDVLLSHGPPRDHGDLASFGGHVGSTALVDAIDRTAPRLVVCGHIHEATGRWWRGGTEIANVALVDGPFGGYALAREPQRFSLAPR